MNPRVSRVLLGTVSTLALLSPLGPVRAQTVDNTTEAATGGLAEIVVTATRREERIQDVPISVAAFSQEKLDAQGLRNIDDLTRLSQYRQVVVKRDRAAKNRLSISAGDSGSPSVA